MCLAGGAAYPCGHTIRSDVWDRLHQNMSATGQRWYCSVCKARYKTAWGVICEIVMPERSLYSTADIPPHSIEDAKRMCVERRFKHARTPQELLDMLPRAKPFDNGAFLQPKPNLEGVYKFDVALFRTVEKLDWNQLYNLSDVAEAKASAAASSAGPPPAAPAVQLLELEEC